MKIESLNGTWMRRIGCGEAHPQTVPYSTLAVGRSTCYRSFTVRESFTRLFLKLDGITYHATVLLNGETLGEMLPYCEYTFDVTALVRPTDNLLEVVLEDMKIQKAIIASETKDVNPEMYAYFVEKISSLGAELVEVPHDELKALSKNSKCVIRTGECKPYSNIILESNVSF